MLSATVPSAPVSPSLRAMISASSTGVAVTSQTRVQVHLGEGAGAGPDPVGHQLVVDLLTEGGDLRHRPARDERERGVAAGGGGVRGLPAADAELQLLPCEAHEVGRGEELPRGEAAGEVEDRGADHHGVVDVEERGGGEVRERYVGRAAVAGCHGGRGGSLTGADRGVGGSGGFEHPRGLRGPAQLAGADGGQGFARFLFNHLRASVGLRRSSLLLPSRRTRPVR
jgi:hypothetical protein